MRVDQYGKPIPILLNRAIFYNMSQTSFQKKKDENLTVQIPSVSKDLKDESLTPTSSTPKRVSIQKCHVTCLHLRGRCFFVISALVKAKLQ